MEEKNVVTMTTKELRQHSQEQKFYATRTIKKGLIISNLIPSIAKSIIITDIAMPSNATFVSVNKDAGVVAWLDGTTMYISTQKNGVKVEANRDSKKMFRCSGLTTLDLSNFDTSNVVNMNEMFCFCSKLNTIKVGDKFKWVNRLSVLGLTGIWQDETGTKYESSDTFSSNVAHTYTKIS